MAFNSLDLALSGLKAAQRAIDVTSHNISNASTLGFTRKILPQETAINGEYLLGVKTGNVIRQVDQALLNDIFNQNSKVENLSIRESYLERIQAFHGPSEANRSISAAMADLSEAFSTAATTPEDQIKLSNVVNKAQEFTARINDFAKLINDQRNQAQNDINFAINQINKQLQVITDLNSRISFLSNAGQSTANELDTRDMAIKELSKYMEVRSFIKDGNQVVVSTKGGVALTDGTARQLVFNPTSVSPNLYYPGGGIGGILIDGDPTRDIAGSDLGGQLGALLNLRDQTLPQYQSQLDELAQKTASRFEQAGLTLFTDSNGTVPPSVADPALVGYVGFSSQIRVNADVLADHTLIRNGTDGFTVNPGSSTMIDRVLDFALGDIQYQQGTGTVDLTTSGTIFGSTGMAPFGRVIGNTNIAALVPDLVSSPDIDVGDSFVLTVNGTSNTITLNSGDSAANLITQINTAFGSNVARLNTQGQLIIEGDGNINVTDISLGTAGLAALGLTAGTTIAQNPSFTVQVGGNAPVTINITAATTPTSLLTQLNTIPGLSASLGSGGNLILTPTRSASLSLNDGIGTPLSFMGVTVSNVPHKPFRTQNLGPNGAVQTQIIGATTVTQLSQQMIARQSQDHSLAQTTIAQEKNYAAMLEKRNADLTGVDLDQQLSELIRLQTAYSASTRVISVVQQTLDSLLDAIR